MAGGISGREYHRSIETEANFRGSRAFGYFRLLRGCRRRRSQNVENVSRHREKKRFCIVVGENQP